MNNNLIIFLLTAVIIISTTAASAFNSDELNKRLLSCKPTKDFSAGGSTMYQISGLTGSTCIFKIQYGALSNKPDLICKVPSTRMREMTSYNPLTVENLKKQFCVISIKSINKQKTIYY